ncbi:hypothetical protein RJ55_07808 [Drechmeria coniospora]|nr:hypothetical protein RJ55_07808 [Drechmeria coniospora]
MEEAIRRHFFHHGKDGSEDDRDGCHWCQLRRFPTHSYAPISVINEVDTHVLPQGFKFINEIALGDGVKPAELSFRSGCTCSNVFDCQYTGCLCLADLEDDEKDDESKAGEHETRDDEMKEEIKDEMKDEIRKGTNNEMHKEMHDETHDEMNDETHDEMHDEMRDEMSDIFVDQYIDADDEALAGKHDHGDDDVRDDDGNDDERDDDDRRSVGDMSRKAYAYHTHASAISQRKDVYLFALDKFTDPASLDPRLRGPPLEVDGEFMSGPTRFINHSCDPNLRIFARVGDHADKHLHDLALFAIKDISKGEELTFDYVDGVSSEADERDGNIGDMTRCLCTESGQSWHLVVAHAPGIRNHDHDKMSTG